MIQFLNDFNRKLDELFTPAVKTILMINVFVFLAINILNTIRPGFVNVVLYWFAQIPQLSLLKAHVWQFVTYAFIQIQPMHLFFNMLILFFFGSALESRWGTRWFWIYYLGAAIGGGVIHAVLSLTVFPGELGPVIGASGATNALMLAFACYHPDAEILMFGVFPIKAKFLVAILIGLDLFMLGGPSGTSHLTHLGGLATGYALLASHHKDPDLRNWRWR